MHEKSHQEEAERGREGKNSTLIVSESMGEDGKVVGRMTFLGRSPLSGTGSRTALMRKREEC